MFWSKRSIAVLSCTLIIALLLACSGLSRVSAEFGDPNQTPEQLIFGDANNDGEVNSVDYALLKNYIGGTLEIFPYKDAIYTMDVDVDGDIDSLDALAVKDFILQRRYSFPADILVANMPQKVFEYNYTNYAWGSIIMKLYIDNEGNVVVPGGYMPIVGDENPITKIPKIELQERYLDLLKASSGTVTPETFQWFDAGICTISGYISDGTTKEVLLKQDGEFLQDNLSPYTASILDWFKGIISTYSFVLF